MSRSHPACRPNAQYATEVNSIVLYFRLFQKTWLTEITERSHLQEKKSRLKQEMAYLLKSLQCRLGAYWSEKLGSNKGIMGCRDLLEMSR